MLLPSETRISILENVYSIIRRMLFAFRNNPKNRDPTKTVQNIEIRPKQSQNSKRRISILETVLEEETRSFNQLPQDLFGAVWWCDCAGKISSAGASYQFG